MATRVVHRDICRLCLSKNVQLVVKLASIPIAEKYCSTASEAKSAETFPVDLYQCNDCGHVQILDVIDSDTLWDDYTYHSGQTKGIVEHFAEVANKIVTSYAPSAGSLVIDVGSNDGSLLRPFKERGFRVLGIDPAKEIAAKATQSGIPTLPELMSINLAERIRAEHGAATVITAFNVFAHADNLNEMAEGIRHMLSPDGIFVFEAQYLVDIVDKALLGTIFHEHMSHHSLKPMVKFLARHGLELFDVERVSIQKGSVVGFVQHKGGKRSISPAVAKLLKLEEEMKLDKVEAMQVFTRKLEAMKAKAASLISQWQRDGAVVAGYGAARSGPTFIAQFGFGPVIKYIFDDHPQKVGKYSPKDGVLVMPTTELLKKMPDVTVILAWIHAKKIVANNRQYLEKGGKFLICCPDIQVVDANYNGEIL